MSYMVKIILASVFVLSAFCLTTAMIYLVVGKKEDDRSPIALFLGAVVSSIAFYASLFILAYLP